MKYGYLILMAGLIIAGCSAKKGTGSSSGNAAAASQAFNFYKPDSASLVQYRVPEWYKDAKFGIFIHWGVYSVPAFGSEWYPHYMYIKGSKVYKHHVKTYGPPSKFGYKDFIPMFKAQKWNPQRWAALFKKSGARYVVEVAMHHDGFAMFDSKVTKWNAAKMGPRKNIVMDLSKAVRAEGLKFGVSDHYANNWYYYTYADHFDTRNPKYAGLYAPEHPKNAPPDSKFLHRWYALAKEMVDDFHPDVLYFDWKFEEPAFKPFRYDIASYYYNQSLRWEKGVVLNYKNNAFPVGSAVLDVERGRLKTIRRPHWQTDTSVGEKSWGYIKNETYRTPKSLIDELVDIVSKNGNLLLNIGPKSDGTIPSQARNILLKMGHWLSVNGEAIYGTRPWKVFGEGPTHLKKSGSFSGIVSYTDKDIRFTTRGDTLYAIALGWPGRNMVIHSLAKSRGLVDQPVSDVTLLADKHPLQYRVRNDGLHIMLPQKKIGNYAYVFRVLFANK